MKNRNEKGFALVLSLVLLLVMSLMGGALIVISSGDHQSNNYSDDYQQTFYVAETAIIEGENYLKNHFLGPWNSKSKNSLKKNIDLFCSLETSNSSIFEKNGCIIDAISSFPYYEIPKNSFRCYCCINSICLISLLFWR